MDDLTRTTVAVPSLTLPCPPLIADAGAPFVRRLLEFFAASIRNPNTRAAYTVAVTTFCCWSEDRGITLQAVSAVAVNGPFYGCATNQGLQHGNLPKK